MKWKFVQECLRGRKHRGIKEFRGRHLRTRAIQSALCCTALGLGYVGEEVGDSFLQGPEGVLHVLHQLGEFCFDLSFAVLNGVLKNHLKRENKLFTSTEK